MLDNLADALPFTCDDRLAAGHRFKVCAPQPCEPARQRKDGAFAHCFRDRLAILPSQEEDASGNAEVAGETGETVSIGTLSDPLALQPREMGCDLSHRPKDNFMSFAAEKIAHH